MTYSRSVALSFALILVAFPWGIRCLSEETRSPVKEGAQALNARLCGASTEAQRKTLGAEWSPFKREIIACPLRMTKKQVLLYVISVDGLRVAQSYKPNEISQSLPKAIIILPDGTRVGELPFAFPFDPPMNLDVTFTDWSGGWPRTVKLYLEDPAVGGNKHLPPLRWNAAAKFYVLKGESNGR